ncbi:MAG TPA: trypsin-like peptidase domain-containing protein [Solirubrobacteraceae bacterium]|jgi:putative serine protease PepD|nr:trypsin-like peptidase domain-containing protein [Solirubrobacteraceae bacterium]
MSTHTSHESPFSQPVAAPTGRRSRRRAPLSRLLALVALSATIIGAGIATGLLFAVGAVGETSAPAAAPASASVTDWASSIYAKAATGVVSITASGIASSTGQSQVATGTGQIVDTRGDILTASHVISGASSITVKLQNGAARRATVLGVDRSTDVAILKIAPAGLVLHPLTLGSAQSLSVGDAVAVIGNPFGFNRSLSTGVVSALDRTIPAPNGFAVAHAIQTDAAINPGNSGGPMLNTRGEVLGVVDQIATGGSGADSDTGVGFAVPIEVVKSELSQLERGAAVAHAFIGANVAQAVEANGAVVESITAGGPAEAAGLRTGDLVTAIDGNQVRGPSGFVASIAARKPGEKVTLTVQRESSTTTLTVTLTNRPSQSPAG